VIKQTFLATVLAAVATTAAASSAWAQAPAKRPPLACGIQIIPLQKGNSWTYHSGTIDYIITILDVAAGKDKDGKPITNIQVEEVNGPRKIALTWTCTPETGLTVPPESLLFTGEPGGGVGVTIANLVVTEATLPPEKLLVQDFQWVHTVKGDANRIPAEGSGATHPAARVEIERHSTVQPSEGVTIGLGYWNAVKITFELRGRGIVGAEKAEIPVKRPGAFWYVKKLGLVKIDDAFDKTWELTVTNVPLPK
jgi:hypothetical protein